ncbi:hypothetical protein GCM10027188_18050 [Lysobacter humi (ex Lee et al. 2017)]
MIAAAVFAAVAGLSACERGDPLADGAVDRPRDGNEADAAQDVGPPSEPVQSASPALGNSVSQPGAASAGGPSSGVTLTLVSQGPKGPYVGDGNGATLYALEGDRDGSKCMGECLTAWPPVAMGGTQPSGGPGLQGAMIASIVRPDGSRQVTYDGHPLYRYAADTGAGSTNGDGVKDKFGTWRLVRPTGAASSASAQGMPGASGTPATGGATSAAGSATSQPATGATR